MVELRGFKVNSLEVENRAVPGTELKLQNQVKEVYRPFGISCA
mgnify:CR=1 FL=1